MLKVILDIKKINFEIGDISKGLFSDMGCSLPKTAPLNQSHKVFIVIMSFLISGCVSYSDTFTTISNTAINKFNHVVYSTTGRNQCKQYCVDHGQDCASVEYRTYDGRCSLNRLTYQQTLDGDPDNIVHSDYYDLYTRDCTFS